MKQVRNLSIVSVSKAFISIGRVGLEIATLGIAALWRDDRLTTNHEAFVALGHDPSDNGGDDVIFFAEFGEGNIIPRLNRREFLRLPEQKITGNIALTTRAAVISIANSDDLETWVVKGSNSSEKVYVCEDGGSQWIYNSPRSLPWTRTRKAHSLEELRLNQCLQEKFLTICYFSAMVYQTSCSGKEYSVMDNNCHDFAKEMYEIACQ